MCKYGKYYIDISFVAEITSGEPTIMEPHKIESIGWFPLDDLPSPLFEPVRVALEAIKTGNRYFEITEDLFQINQAAYTVPVMNKRVSRTGGVCVCSIKR